MSLELEEKKLFVDQLEIGMHVTKLDRAWQDTDFLFQGFIIQSDEDIADLERQCEYVFIEIKHQSIKRPVNRKVERRKGKRGLFARSIKGNKGATVQPTGEHTTSNNSILLKTKVTYINKVNVESEFPKAKKNYQYAKQLSKNIMDGIRIGQTLDMNESKIVVQGIVESIIRNSNALVWLTKLKNKDEYTAEHSLNVCILSVAFARHLGHSEHEIRIIGLCGLLHDVGKAKVPLEVLNKPGRFTDEEFEIMNMHPLHGKNLLMSTPGAVSATIDVAFSHHERIDQNGYPRKLMNHQIPYYAKLVAITDAYDAITSNRCYDKGRSSMEALDIIYKNKGRQFDEELAIEFIKCIGLYPPGSIVELTNGEVGIIIASHQDNKLKPRIMLVLDESKTKTKEKVINLLEGDLDASNHPYEILKEIPDGKYEIKIKDFVDRGLVIHKAET